MFSDDISHRNPNYSVPAGNGLVPLTIYSVANLIQMSCDSTRCVADVQRIFSAIRRGCHGLGISAVRVLTAKVSLDFKFRRGNTPRAKARVGVSAG